MVVYADILVLLNFIVDYFLLTAAARILRRNIPLGRTLLSALVGAISSLYIFVPVSNFIMEFCVRFITCALMTLTSFGFLNLKSFFRNAGILFVTTCAYAGLMIAVWYLLKPSGMVINNSVVYFNISPLILITASVATYLLFMLFSSVFARTASSAEKCDITVCADGGSIDIKGIIDTGNSLEDFLGGSEVIIADKACVNKLFGSTDPEHDERLKSRYRIMPCSTVSGGGILEGFRLDSAVVTDGQHTVKLEKPILAISKTAIRDDYTAIVNPRIFM